jgi:hypothetical protein
VFQQRNGRIDRYGQSQQPDIRYFMIDSTNPKIKGDMRIMEILIQKEEQAYKNIGDPTLLMGKFNVEEEEQVTASAIEAGTAPDAFGAQLAQAEDEVDPFEALMAGATQSETPTQISEDDMLFADVEYVKTAIHYFSKDARNVVQNLQTVDGVEISISPELRRRLSALLPDEAMPSEDYLRLSRTRNSRCRKWCAVCRTAFPKPRGRRRNTCGNYTRSLHGLTTSPVCFTDATKPLSSVFRMAWAKTTSSSSWPGRYPTASRLRWCRILPP